VADTDATQAVDETEDWENEVTTPGSSWTRGERITGVILGAILTIFLYWAGADLRVPAHAPALLGYTVGFLIIALIGVIACTVVAHLLHHHRAAIGSYSARQGKGLGIGFVAVLGKIWHGLAGWAQGRADRRELSPGGEGDEDRAEDDVMEHLAAAVVKAWGSPVDLIRTATAQFTAYLEDPRVADAIEANRPAAQDALGREYGAPVWIGEYQSPDGYRLRLFALPEDNNPKPAGAPASAAPVLAEPPAPIRKEVAMPTSAAPFERGARLADLVPPQARPLINMVDDMTPANDNDLRDLLRGLAATQHDLGQAVQALHERCISRGVRLDKNAMQATHDAADALVGCSEALTKAWTKADEHYGTVSEEVAGGLVLPESGDYLTGNGAR
jgi:hypothetical protein